MGKTLSPQKMLARGNAGFERAIRSSSFNAYDSGRRPDYVAQPYTIEDVVEAVNAARDKGLKISVCSGGHSWSQNHIRDGGMLINLARLNAMEIDPDAKTAIVGPGCHGGDLDAALEKLQLFFPVGHAYTIGLGGYLLQGGFGWNRRVLGMACESVTAMDIILADGRLVHASEAENSDLFWVARGAGAGFFGVVVRFHLKLYDRPRFSGFKIQVFRIRHLEDVMSWAEAIGRQTAETVEFQLLIHRKAMGIFTQGIEVSAFVLADSRRAAKQAVAFIDRSPLRPKASFTLPLIGMSLKWIMRAADKVLFLPDLRWFADNAWLRSPVSAVLPIVRKIVDTQPASPSHIYWQVWNRQIHPRGDMAFSLEGDSYLALYGAFRTGEQSVPEREEWATRSARALEPYSTGIQLGDENLARRPAEFMAPDHLAKVEQLRLKYDPEGRFYTYGHRSQRIHGAALSAQGLRQAPDR